MQANAVEIIGKVSPAAKEKILSGEVRINKEVIEEIATASNEAIAEIVRRIENGTFGTERPDTYDGQSGGNVVHVSFLGEGASNSDISPEVRRQWELIIGSITGEYFHGLQDAAKSSSPAKLKNALRAYIIQLEDLYRQL